jgi:cysteine desulfurase
LKSFNNIIYLDNNATTPCDPKVIEAMLPYFDGLYGNSSSSHLLGRQASKAVATAREYISDCIDCSASSIYFTSCATEANNLVILGLSNAENKRRSIVVSEIEHKSVLGPCHSLAARGYKIKTLPVTNNGVVNLDAARSLINEDTLLVSVQAANNEIGTLQPVHAIADIAHEIGALFHCDAAQMLGKLSVSVDDMRADFLSFSTHKAYGQERLISLG